jgi:hypothetical protein
VDNELFGCVVPFPTGVWRYSEDEFPENDEYWRLDNYGVIHCALIFGQASEADAARQAFESHAWMIRLSSTPTSAGETTLWALQIGVSGGSRYLVLRQHPGDSGFDVLNLR